MLSLLVSHTMYRNLHKYFIDLLTSYLIQYSSGYDSRFPPKRPWFESQVPQYYFIFCCCCFLFTFVVFILIFFFSFLSLTASTIHQFLHLGIKSQKAVDILYCVQKFSLFLCSHSTCLHIRAIFDHTNEVFMQQNMFTGYILHFS